MSHPTQEFIDAISRRLSAIVAPFAGKPDYGNLRQGGTWGYVLSRIEDPYVSWETYYEVPAPDHEDTDFLHFKYHFDGQFAVPGKSIDRCNREPNISTTDEEEACRLFQQRIEEIPEDRARCGAAAEI